MNTTISIHFRNLFAQNFVNTVENNQFYLYVLNFFASTDCCSKKQVKYDYGSKKIDRQFSVRGVAPLGDKKIHSFIFDVFCDKTFNWLTNH
jgi:hypothetical protein